MDFQVGKDQKLIINLVWPNNKPIYKLVSCDEVALSPVPLFRARASPYAGKRGTGDEASDEVH